MPPDPHSASMLTHTHSLHLFAPPQGKTSYATDSLSHLIYIQEMDDLSSVQPVLNQPDKGSGTISLPEAVHNADNSDTESH